MQREADHNPAEGTLEINVLDGRTFNGFTIVVALVSLSIAAIATIYGRRAIFPPRRRLTVFINSSRDGATIPDSPSLRLATVTFSNTGRHAIESARFDRDRPLIIDIGVPIQHVAMGAAPRPGVRLSHRGSTVAFGPDLLNPGESVITEIYASGDPTPKSRMRVDNHVLVDAIVETRRGRPPSLLRRQAPRLVLALILLAPSIAALIDSRGDIADYVLPRPTASISPDHGPSSGCVTIRGENYRSTEKIEVWAADFPESAYPTYTETKACPTLQMGKGTTTSSIKGEVFFTFALPPGCSGALIFFVDGNRHDAVTYWVT